MTRPAGPREYWRRQRLVQHKRGHRNRLQKDADVLAMKAAFLILYGSTGAISGSCAALHWQDGEPLAGHQVQYWRENDPVFRGHLLEARLRFAESLETEAHRRAVIGVDKPVYYQGEVVGEIREFSDGLLTLLLKANLPDKYRERIDISLDVRREIERMATEMGVPLELAEAEWARLEPALLRKGG